MHPISFLIGLFLLIFIGYEELSGHQIQELMFIASAGHYVSGGYLNASSTYSILFFFLVIFALALFLYGIWGVKDNE